MEDLFEGLAHLTGAVSGRAGDVELRGGKLVEAIDELRAGDLLDVNQGTQGDLASVGAAHIELVDVVDAGAGFAFRLNVGLPLPAEAIEVVDEISAHEGLHGGVDVAEIDLLLQSLFAVNVSVELRNGRLIGGNGGGYLGAFGD